VLVVVHVHTDFNTLMVPDSSVFHPFSGSFSCPVRPVVKDKCLNALQ